MNKTMYGLFQRISVRMPSSLLELESLFYVTSFEDLVNTLIEFINNDIDELAQDKDFLITIDHFFTT